ncbi:MAG: RNA pseudouridine synthase [Saprospiraceae bacterium]|nr:RNA pseudouridine synthase [Saprospiraceae bacterium]MBP7679794.1 RNA pseudouridine synthase [Saprospiraceae bacterium]
MTENTVATSSLVIQKNNQFIAFNKPAGTPTQPDKTGDTSLWQLAEIYCKHKLYPAHRLDRPVSGVVLFAKSKNAIQHIETQFREQTVEKTYLAVVDNLPPQPMGTLQHYIIKDSKKNIGIAYDAPRPDALLSTLQYAVLGSSENYHLLKIVLQTGRFHQIRAQLRAVGCHIKGDVKYGARRSNKDRSIHLHAWQLSFNHTVTEERVHLIAAIPDENLWNSLKEFTFA